MTQVGQRNERCGRRWVALAVAALAAAAVPAHADQTISPGKESIFVSASNVAIPANTPGPILSGQLLKGRKKTVIEITMTWTTFPTSGTAKTAVRAVVNGFYSEPKSGFVGWPAGQACPGPAVCTSTARAFLDVDAAEVDAPGFFVGQPLTITMEAEQDGSPGNLVYAVLEARVQKK